MTRTLPWSVLSGVGSSSAHVMNWLLLYFYLKNNANVFTHKRIYIEYIKLLGSIRKCLFGIFK